MIALRTAFIGIIIPLAWGMNGTTCIQDNCKNGGNCSHPDVNCTCPPQWSGDICNIPICSPSCDNGNCTGPDVCTCNGGWNGTTCSQPICSPSCDNGNCTEPDVCTCNEGWNGTTCFQAICSRSCDNGNCTEPNVCTCNEGWNGTTCSQPICTHNCSGRGTCVGPETCINCTDGWTGDSCAEAICSPPNCYNGNCTDISLKTICSPDCDNGNCTEPGVCSCDEGWNGTTCSDAICSPSCENGNCTEPDVCICNEGWNGTTCFQAICRNITCQNDGICSAPEVCNCTEDWKGLECEIPICRNITCQNGGICSAPEICNCTEDWEGSECEIPICNDDFCKNGGKCLFPNTNCSCPDGWDGPQCDSAMCTVGFCHNEGVCSFPDQNCTCTGDWSGPQCRTTESLNIILYLGIGLSVLIAVVIAVIMIAVIAICSCKRKNQLQKEKNNRVDLTNISEKYSEEGISLASYKRTLNHQAPLLSNETLSLGVSWNKHGKSLSRKEDKKEESKFSYHAPNSKKPVKPHHHMSKQTQLKETKQQNSSTVVELTSKREINSVKPHSGLSGNTDSSSKEKKTEEPKEKMEEKQKKLTPQSNSKPLKSKLKQNFEERKELEEVESRNLMSHSNLMPEVEFKPKKIIKPKPATKPKEKNSMAYSFDPEENSSKRLRKEMGVKTKPQSDEPEHKPKIKPKPQVRPKPNIKPKPEPRQPKEVPHLVASSLDLEKNPSEVSTEKVELKLKKHNPQLKIVFEADSKQNISPKPEPKEEMNSVVKSLDEKKSCTVSTEKGKVRLVLTGSNQDLQTQLTEKVKPQLTKEKTFAGKSFEQIDSEKIDDPTKKVLKIAKRREHRPAPPPPVHIHQKTEGKHLQKEKRDRNDSTNCGDVVSKSNKSESDDRNPKSTSSGTKENHQQTRLKQVQKHASRDKSSEHQEIFNSRCEKIAPVKPAVKPLQGTKKTALVGAAHSKVDVSIQLKKSAKGDQSSQRMDNPTYDGLEVTPLKTLHNPTYDMDVKKHGKFNEAKVSKEPVNQPEVPHDYDYPCITVKSKHSKENAKDDSPQHVYEIVDQSNSAIVKAKGIRMEHEDKQRKEQNRKENKKPLIPPNMKHQQHKHEEKECSPLHYAVTSIGNIRLLSGAKKQTVNSNSCEDPHTYAVLEPSPTHKSTNYEAKRQRASIGHAYAILEGPTPVSPDDENDKS